MLSPLSHRLSLNWTADHFPFAFLVLAFCLVLVLSVALGVVFLFAVFCNGIVTAAGLCTGPYQFTLLASNQMAAICMH